MELGGVYAVHELLLSGEEATPCTSEQMHVNEVSGKNLWKGERDWRGVMDETHLSIDAGEISHRGLLICFDAGICSHRANYAAVCFTALI